MKNRLFPTLVVDDFLNDPDDLISHANNQDYFFLDNQVGPGQRSELLHLLDEELFIYIGNKILSCYSFYNSDISWNAKAHYHKVDSRYNKGWIHNDKPMILTAIIYLNKNNLDSGTSLYFPKKPYNYCIHTDVKEKMFYNLNSNKDYVITDYEKKCTDENNNLFNEVLNVKSVFNRLFCFESNIYHAAHAFPKDNSRLTLIYFFNKIHLADHTFPLVLHQ